MIREVETNIGTIPIEDFREIIAVQNGFDSYTQMRSKGVRIGRGYDTPEDPVLYVDLDGTLAEFNYAPSMDVLYEKGYFLNLNPIPGVLEGIKEFMRSHPEIRVYVLSAYLADSKYALQEKTMWLDRNLPELDSESQLFVKCGETKALVPFPGENAFLLDDHSQNLLDWEKAGFKGIKLLNGINGKGKKWGGSRISAALSPDVFAKELYALITR